MTEKAFADLQNRLERGGPAAVFDQLIQTLRETKQYHKLFDAHCLQKKHALGAPLTKPTSFHDIPAMQRDEFETAYVAAAREVGQLLLAEGKLGQSFLYFHAIADTEPLRAAIDAAVVSSISSEEAEELIDLAFFKLIHPVKGMQIMLLTHGTCNTITALDQAFMNLTTEQREDCAALLVRTLHQDVMNSVEHEVKQRIPFSEPAKNLRELIAGRDWLFSENNYHVDTSHLHSTVRFARSLSLGQPEIALARDLAEYGARLSSQFQYPAERPFADFYPAHIQFFKYLAKDDRAGALSYFQVQLEQETDPSDQALVAYVIVDLLARTNQLDAAIPLAEKYLLSTDRDFGSAFAELCQKAGRFDVLMRTAEERSDLVTYATAMVQQSQLGSPQ